ncbi:VOC family protein [Streptosporangium sp. DT93]|uniref:VOC family protein n=1 Tax=Streptosporangium sp. DT93 TaxID=3393428 RepID=UPI003CE7CAEE
MLDAPDAGELARFYVRLLGWRITAEKPGWVVLMPSDGVAYVSFQTEPEYVRPVWPATGGRQQMMMHLDVEVEDLEAAVAHAIEVGATLPDHQPQETVRVLLDPAGHPFCLYTDTSPDEGPG